MSTNFSCRSYNSVISSAVNGLDWTLPVGLGSDENEQAKDGASACGAGDALQRVKSNTAGRQRVESMLKQDFDNEK
jgi:hypothetical protein